jgi:hypothetical protein
MRIFLSFLFCSAALQGMEGLEGLPAAAPEPAEVNHGYDRPVLKQAILKQAKPLRRQLPAGAIAIPAIDLIAQKYKDDVLALLTNVPELDREFTDDEVMNSLAYFQKQYSINYQSFMAKVKSLNGQPDSDQFKLQRYQLAFDFTLVARQAHNDNEDFHKEATHALTDQQIALQGAHNEQVAKTRIVTLRGYGAVAAGFLLTLITGLATYFGHPGNGSTCSSNNTTL